MTTIVTDGDEIAFVVAAAAEDRYVDVLNNSNGKEVRLKNRTQLKHLTGGLDVPENHYTIEDVQEPEPIENALHSVKMRIESFKRACKADKVEVYLSGEGNFRDDIPLPKKYKWNREDSLKPVLLGEVRDYLTKYHNAVKVDGREVDDKLAERMWDGYQSGDIVVGVTQDKDAMGCNGWVFNPNKMTEPYLVSGLGKLYMEKGKLKGEGYKWLMSQCLIGDTTDGYQPRDLCDAKFGDKACFNLLNELNTTKEVTQAVVDKYREWYPEPVTYTSWNGEEYTKNWLEIFQMYFDCARMRRWSDDVVYLKDVLDKIGVECEL